MNFDDAKTSLELWHSTPRDDDAVITNYDGREDGFFLGLLMGTEIVEHFSSLQQVREIVDRNGDER